MSPSFVNPNDFFMTVIFLLPGIFVFVNFLCYATSNQRFFPPLLDSILEIVFVLVLPILFMLVDLQFKNDCCDRVATATFSPDHKLTLYLFLIWFLFSYVRLRNTKEAIAPLMYLLLICGVCVGIVLNVLVMLQTPLGYFVNPAIILFCLTLLLEKQRTFNNTQATLTSKSGGWIRRLFDFLYNLPLAINFPLLLVLSVPLAAVLMGILILLGQKPDALIRAFTDTYYHGLSQIEHECANVDCGGHYLCSVAANGHKSVVNPKRYGTRNGALIRCNRQLLISNAFEQLLEEKAPGIHRFIRRKYNRVGGFIHRYYSVFSIKWLSDLVYVLMKPLEWLFLLTLYLFDPEPESRIERQYIDRKAFAEFVKEKQRT